MVARMCSTGWLAVGIAILRATPVHFTACLNYIAT